MIAVFEKRDPFLMKAWQGKNPEGFPPMFHYHAELIYVKSGSLFLVMEGQSLVLQAGQMFVLFPYLTHSYRYVPDTEVRILLFDPAGTAFTNTLLTQIPRYPIVDGTPYGEIIGRAVDKLRQGKVKTANGYLNAVLGEFLDMVTLETRPDISDNTTAQVLEYCATHFAEPITLKTVADALYLSQSYVSKIFSDKLRYGFREYVNTLRTENAKKLLEDSTASISEVMYACGFSNQSSFNRVFRDFCGTTPLQYRKNCALQQAEPISD